MDRGALRRVVLGAGLALAAWEAHGPPARAEPAPGKPNLMLILDSSGSMWAQIGGVNKVASARDGIVAVARRHRDRLNVGLVSFGHSTSAGCNGAEVVLAPGAHDPDQVRARVDRLIPKGATPLAASLSAAFEASDASEDRTTLIVIADGLDNCRADPCAVAAELKAARPDLTAHVIAFDAVDQDKLKGLRCVAENTGGTFFPAVNEDDLISALYTISDAAAAAPPAAPAAPRPEASRLAEAEPQAASDEPPLPRRAPSAEEDATGARAATREPDPEPPAEATPPAQAEPPARPVKEAPPVAPPPAPVQVSLAARLTEHGPALRSGLVWRIFEPRPGRDGRYRLLGTHRDPAPTVALPPGAYLVNAAYGLSNLTRKINVNRDTPAQELFVLNAGGLRLGAVLAGGAPIAPGTVRYDIYADEADQYGNREKVLGDAKAGTVIRLNAGSYHVVSVYGDANAVVRADVTVEPGRLSEATINHSAAKVTFRLVSRPGGEALADTQWSVLTPGGDVVKESAGALPTHVLAAGSYVVVARHYGSTYERDFIVESGETRQIEVLAR